MTMTMTMTRILNKRIFNISFVWDTDMAAMLIVFCVAWARVKPQEFKAINELHFF